MACLTAAAMSEKLARAGPGPRSFDGTGGKKSRVGPAGSDARLGREETTEGAPRAGGPAVSP